MASTDDVTRLVIDAVGEDGLERLQAAGVATVLEHELVAYEREHEDSNERLKALALASMRAAELRSMICEIYMVKDAAGITGIRLVVCDPDGDEEATMKKVAGLMRWTAEMGTKTGKKARRAGASGA